MSILRRSILATTFLGLLAFAVPMSASATNQFSFHVHGYVAEAYFDTWTSPTLVTEVYVNTGEAVGGNQTPYTFVQADQVDFSTNPYGDLVALEYGYVPTSALNISSKLDSASLAGDIPATDINGNPVTLSLNLSWTAIGAPSKSVSNSHFSGYGFKENSHQSGTSAPATASGSISDGSMEWTGGYPAQFADLNKVTENATVTG